MKTIKTLGGDIVSQCPECCCYHEPICGPDRTITLTLTIPEALLNFILLDFPLSDTDRREFNYDSGTMWAAFDLTNLVTKELIKQEIGTESNNDNN